MDISDSAGALLQALAAKQARLTATWWRKVWQLCRLVLFRRRNAFEDAVVALERHDLAFVAKYLYCAAVATPGAARVSLHALHAPHPLFNFGREELQAQHVLDEVAELPAVLFVHGLGGQMAQFDPLMAVLLQCAEIYAVDLPGFGDLRCRFPPNRHSPLAAEHQREVAELVLALGLLAFSTPHIVALLKAYVEQHIPEGKRLLLVGHSMGTHLAVKLANALPPGRVEGLVLLSPPEFKEAGDGPGTRSEGRSHRGLLAWRRLFVSVVRSAAVVDVFRAWDRLEGLHSASVLRQVPASAPFYMRLRQFRWNLDIDTRPLLAYIRGFQPATMAEAAAAAEQFHADPLDTNVYAKTYIVCGADDHVTPPCWGQALAQRLGRRAGFAEVKGAGHGLLLAKAQLVAGLVLQHLETQLPQRLRLLPAWVLQLKARILGDKWGLKNERKWLQTQSVLGAIARRSGTDVAPLLGMKTLREGDPTHSPEVLERDFAGAARTLVAIIDISADIPPYQPLLFARVRYHKFATVLKVVPDAETVRGFVALVDEILADAAAARPLVAVHCHYGFNRTGFLICCYLVERLGWSTQEAVAGFKAAKPPGIKHQHFIDALYLRYDH